MRILVTNDDGVDAVGLHVLARRLSELGEVVVAAPDREYIRGDQIYSTWLTDPERVRRYATDDVEEVAEVSRLLGGAAYALAQMAPRRYERLADAGAATGVIDPLLVRAGRGLTPTPRALALRERVGPLVADAQMVLSPAEGGGRSCRQAQPESSARKVRRGQLLT